MAQNFTDNCFDANNAAQTDLQNIENNFAALKSQFGGASAPANTVAGMPWVDTTNHILKIRNEANAAWLSIFDMATGQPIGTPAPTVPVAATLAEVIALNSTKFVNGAELYNLLAGVEVPGGYTNSTAGSWSFTCDPRTRRIKLTIVGGDGGGGGGGTAYNPGDSENSPQPANPAGSGGAGGASIKTFLVTPGTVLSGTVGSAGSGGTSIYGSATNGTAGTATTCTQSGQVANGGTGGAYGAGGAHGAGGTASGGDTNTTGLTGGGGAGGIASAGGNGLPGGVSIKEFFS